MKTRILLIASLLFAIATHAQQSYQTNFPATENPISESGRWRNGGAQGIDWGNVQTSGGQAHGTVISGAPPFNDSTAVLTGAWGPNQYAKSTVRINSADASSQQEIELRTNTTIIAHSITGYEFDVNVKNGQAYLVIVRWNGPLNNFTFCVNGGGCTSSSPTVVNIPAINGDVFEANTIGSKHTLYKNGVSVFSTTDGTYTGGSPGIGFWQTGGTTGNLLDFGLTNFSASDFTYIAASCNRADVNAIINGPIHVAVNGDVIAIPAGNCTSPSLITVPAGIGITITGFGTPNSTPGTFGAGASCASTTITGPNGTNMFSMSPTFGNSLSRLSCMNLLPPASGSWGFPLNMNGTCALGGCPNLRLDNLTMPERWNTGGQTGAAGGAVNNLFGVADHNTIGDNLNGTNGLISFPWIDVGHGSWQGLGIWGDQSWTSADTFGTSQAFYFENNLFTNVNPTDTEIFSTAAGGARIVCRFNIGNSLTQSGFCSAHGTDTGGRLRSLRIWEGYYNTLSCTGTNGGQCNSVWPSRGGTGISFGNTIINAGAATKGLTSLGAQRRWRDGTVFGDCDGSSPWDANDTPDGSGVGKNYFSGTIGSAVKQTVATNLGYVITDSGAPGWSVNQWVSYPNPFSYHDVTTVHNGSDIAGGPSSANSFFADTVDYGSGFNPSAGQSYQIKRAFACLDQGGRGAGLLVKDTVPGNGVPVLAATNLPGPVNQAIDPVYEAADVMPAGASDTVSGPIANTDFYSEAVNQPAQTSASFPFSGANISQPVTSFSCSNPSANCTYTVATTTGFVINGYARAAGTLPGLNGTWWSSQGSGKITGITGTTITISIPGVASITGGAGGAIVTMGSGHGTLANRPATCDPTVGYFATDQGTWNQTGSTTQRGLWYTCTAPNTWTQTYTPFCYPHPLTTGGVCQNAGGSPTVTLSPSSLAFGSVLVGSSSASKTITLTNTGSATLTISGITINGTNFADFAQTNNCGLSVLAGGSCTITVIFTPLSAASFSAQVSITDNATGSPHTVALTGTGTTAAPGISFAPTSITFAALTVGMSSAPTAVTVTNTGSGTLTISNVIISGGNATSFTQTNNCTSVAPAGTCTINVTLKPQAAGALASSVSVTDNAPASPQSVPISGTGLGVPSISFTPSSLPFGNQTVSGTTAALSTTVKNIGTGTLTLSSVTLTGANAGDFAISGNTCGGSLVVNATCVVSVTFTPGAPGARIANLTFTDNAAGSPQNVALTGTGTQAGAGFSPTSLDFPPQTVNTTSTPLTTTLTNTGSATLNISSIAITGANASDFAISAKTCGATLAASGTCTVSVNFTPAAGGARAANLSFTDNAPASPQAVPLTGTGNVTSIAISPASLTFPATIVGQSSAAQVLTMTNTGGSSITVSAISVGGDFSQTNNCIGTLVPGQFCTVNVTFTPTATGLRSSTAIFTDTAPGSPQSVAVSGTGTQAGAQVSPAAITFPNTPVSTTSGAQVATLTNNGTATLNISSIALGGTDPSYFTISANTCGATLAVATSCTVSVTFTPQAAITATATLSFTDSGPGSPQVVTLTGTGTFVAVSFNPASVTFPNTPVSTPSALIPVILTNNGNGTLTIASITIIGANASNFTQTNNCGASISGGGSCTINVKFTPSAIGSRTASISVADNAAGSPQTVSLQGTGFTPAPLVSLSRASINFADQTISTPSNPQVVILQNIGTASLAITSTSITGANPGDFGSSTTCSGSLAVNAACTYTFIFTPTGAGARAATFNLVTNAASSPDTIALSGNGLAGPNTTPAPQMPFGINLPWGLPDALRCNGQFRERACIGGSASHGIYSVARMEVQRKSGSGSAAGSGLANRESGNLAQGAHDRFRCTGRADEATKRNDGEIRQGIRSLEFSGTESARSAAVEWCRTAPASASWGAA